MTKIILDGFIVVQEADLAVVQEELLTHTVLTRSEPGCIVFKVDQCLVDRCKFYVYEEFASEESFQRHQERTQTSRWGMVTKDVRRYYNINRV